MSEHVQPEHVTDLSNAIRMLHSLLAELVREEAPASSRIQDVDLVASNPAGANDQARASYDQAVQVDNPYAVTVELHGSSDGGGNVLMRVPAHTTRVLTIRVRELSLKAIGGAPAGVIPATVVRFDTPQPAGLYPYAP